MRSSDEQEAFSVDRAQQHSSAWRDYCKPQAEFAARSHPALNRLCKFISSYTCSDRILAAFADAESAPGSDLLGEAVSDDMQEPPMYVSGPPSEELQWRCHVKNKCRRLLLRLLTVTLHGYSCHSNKFQVVQELTAASDCFDDMEVLVNSVLSLKRVWWASAKQLTQSTPAQYPYEELGNAASIWALMQEATDRSLIGAVPCQR